MPTTPALTDQRSAFAHVVAVHRAFVTALADWEHYGPPDTRSLTDPIGGEPLREISTVFLDSVLVNGRNLIEFYTRDRSMSSARATDILIDDFDVKVPGNVRTLNSFKYAIEVHVLHMTAHRDKQYRTANPDPDRRWIKWNKRTGRLGDVIESSIRHVVRQNKPWSVMFAELSDACTIRRADPTAHWPTDLAGPKQIEQRARKYKL